MANFHINPETGEPGNCTAQPGNCKYGEAKHYESKAEAREAYERSQADSFTAKVTHVSVTPENWKTATASIIGNFEESQAEAQRITANGKFGVVEAYYDGSLKEYEYQEEPIEDDYDDEDAYEEAMDEYNDWYANESSSSYSGPDEVDLESYLLEYNTVTYESRAEFEEALKDGRAATVGSGNSIIGFIDEEMNGKVASDIDVDPYNDGRIFYYELFTYDGAK